MTTVLVLFCVGVAVARSVQGYTTRSYDLDVPGSQPIRIIEADPGWDLNTRKPPLPNLDTIKSNYKPFRHRGEKDDRFKHRPDLEHRTTKPDVIANRNDRFPENSEKLKKFLNSYSQNINVKQAEDQMHLDEKFVDIPDDSDTDDLDKPEKSKSWNLLHFDKIQQQGPQDHKGWVSMEAVPWSVSKISKWHGKPKKDKYQNNQNQNQNQHNNGYYEQNSRPYNDRFQTPDYSRPSYNSKPIKPIRPSPGYYDDPLEEGDEEDPVDDEYFNRRPSFPRPSATYGHKVNLHTVQTYGNSNGNAGSFGNNKRPFNDRDTHCNNPSHHGGGPGGGPGGHIHDDGGILTDGMPPNFPEHDYGNRRRGVVDSSASPSGTSSHPFKGDVLPPLDDGRVNMTTSHGGLLQVDATFQSVEEAAQKHHKRQRLKVRRSQQRRPVKVRPQLGALTSQASQVQYQVQNGDNLVGASAPGSSVSDPSAVLAAVGAGMIPAGMALLVPMAMSGKRRRRQARNPELLTISPYASSVQLTLPSSL